MEDKYLKNNGLGSLKHTHRLQVSKSDRQHCSQLNKKKKRRQTIDKYKINKKQTH